MRHGERDTLRRAFQAVLATGLLLALALPWDGDADGTSSSGWGVLLQGDLVEDAFSRVVLVVAPLVVASTALLAVVCVYRPGARLLLLSRLAAGLGLLAITVLLIVVLAAGASVRAGLPTAMVLLLGWLAPPSAVADDRPPDARR